MSTPPVLQDCRALVTGGAKGIGAAISERLAAAGADLVVSGRNAVELDAYAAELADRTGRKVAVVAADLAEPDAPERLAERGLGGAGRAGPAGQQRRYVDHRPGGRGARRRTGTRCSR